ncbi:DUF4394 domain-containing protein [Runella sp. MFBS21]|uniref:DUF4394 domain-containing protein n=1 Tax=Runella sp. MFBS21 TaxID=3034018 RepID=UPI0023F98DAE|nr:DUF4394 domain-containing protein [Runella sp. MFBS21]MDF7819638.1 DUF4394 domain-containing protein [Runella sp. MFBS21]
MSYAKTLSLKGLLLLVVLSTFYACTDHRLPPDPTTLPDANFYALTDGNQLLSYNLRSLSSAQATVSISGLQQGEQMLSIDFRPATGQLYGVGSTSRIYVINPMTGAARAIGNPFSPALNGTMVALDFNPTVDRIRLVTNTGQNLRLHPETGAVVAPDGNINGVAGATITAVAYTNNRAGVTTTTLYDIDPATDRLYKQDPPNNGGLVDVGPLGLDITAAGGFDIAPDGNAIAAVTVFGQSELNQIDLNTGRLQKLGTLSGNIIGIAIPTEPVAYAIDASNNLHIFNPMNPVLTTKTIMGLQPSETLLGIDMRPVNGQLYALGSTSRIYTINVNNNTTATATALGSGPFSPALSGTNFGFDFNPVPDLIRVVSNAQQNLRVSPVTGAVTTTDPNLNPGAAVVSAAAYTNNFAGTATTTLYDIETPTGSNAMLYMQNPPNNGTLVAIGSLGITVESANGFDIGGASGTAYALLRSGGTTRVYTINLSTGAATGGATLPGNPTINGMTVGLGF